MLILFQDSVLARAKKLIACFTVGGGAAAGDVSL